MLSYQHAFHAGNRADVHKHLALVALLGRLQHKPTPLCYVDSHAGRGVYDLAGVEAQKTREARAGILQLVDRASESAPAALPHGVRAYLELVASFNAVAGSGDSTGIRFYPGSAALAGALLREQDRAILLELHPQELTALRQAMRGDRRVAIHGRDCFEGLPAVLPPPIRRGLVLIDPSYEIREDYTSVATLLGKALARWPNGVFVLWYPLLADRRHDALVRRLEQLDPPDWLISEYRFAEAAVGLIGSGLAIVNAPWRFGESLAGAMGFVMRVLDDGGRGHYTQHGPD